MQRQTPFKSDRQLQEELDQQFQDEFEVSEQPDNLSVVGAAVSVEGAQGDEQKALASKQSLETHETQETQGASEAQEVDAAASKELEELERRRAEFRTEHQKTLKHLQTQSERAAEKEVQRSKETALRKARDAQRVIDRQQVMIVQGKLKGYKSRVERARTDEKESGKKQFILLSGIQTKNRDTNYTFADEVDMLLDGAESTDAMQKAIRAKLLQKGVDLSKSGVIQYTSSSQLNEILRDALALVVGDRIESTPVCGM